MEKKIRHSLKWTKKKNEPKYIFIGCWNDMSRVCPNMSGRHREHLNSAEESRIRLLIHSTFNVTLVKIIQKIFLHCTHPIPTFISTFFMIWRNKINCIVWKIETKEILHPYLQFNLNHFFWSEPINNCKETVNLKNPNVKYT